MTLPTWNEMPMCECPHCGCKWQKDDYYNMDVGDVLECPRCGEKIEVTLKECTMMLEFDVPGKK